MKFIGNAHLFDEFREVLQRGRLSSTFLFVGEDGIGKRTFALRLAQSLLCTQRPAWELTPCQTCPSCRQVQAGSHPDLEQIARPADRSFLPVDIFLGDRQHRMREGLCHWISLRPAAGTRKIAIIDDADYLNEEGANCLLKTLEEPPPQSLLILIGTSLHRQLPTIRSRCQIIRFRSLSETEVVELLLMQGAVADAQEAESLAVMAGGSPAIARQLCDASLRQMRSELLETLAQADWDSGELARQIVAYMEESGTEASLKRQRLREVIHQAGEFYRHHMRQQCHATTMGDDCLTRALAVAHSQAVLDEERASDCVLRCFAALAQVDANAHPTTLVSAWLDDLHQLSRGCPTTS